ncbi:MAG: hypothetical protein HCA25_07105 [Dolichospermum sp. DET50]|nr:hypothetical protein [Dolichospermum sp. DET66]MBS3032052.1 hypothetical protein [Dolichospermum sp. DET67]MBS3037256.1 hypothetical protein [Dolichospermum sp. DET50]QSX70869.1 MAG: hypothetical protein EZY12_06325 [Dolichospermum sp. DET69]
MLIPGRNSSIFYVLNILGIQAWEESVVSCQLSVVSCQWLVVSGSEEERKKKGK